MQPALAPCQPRSRSRPGVGLRVPEPVERTLAQPSGGRRPASTPRAFPGAHSHTRRRPGEQTRLGALCARRLRRFPRRFGSSQGAVARPPAPRSSSWASEGAWARVAWRARPEGGGDPGCPLGTGPRRASQASRGAGPEPSRGGRDGSAGNRAAREGGRAAGGAAPPRTLTWRNRTGLPTPQGPAELEGRRAA